MKKVNALKKICSSIFIGLMAITILFPFYWLIVSALKTEKENFSIPPTLFPHNVTFENILNVVEKSSIPTYFMNSVINALLTVVVVLIAGSLAAYSMSRFKFKGKSTIFVMILLAQIMPLTTLIIPMYVVLGKLKLVNTHFSLVATYSGILIPIAIWMLTSYFNSIPRDIDEAAIIDGCSRVGILFKIILPLSRPGVMAVSLTTIITVWQELMIAMTFTNKDSMRTLMAGVSSFITKSGIQWGPLNASGILASVPIIIVYFFFQKALVKGLTSGSVKG